MLLDLVLEGRWTIRSKRVSKIDSGAEEDNDHAQFVFLEVQLLLIQVGHMHSGNASPHRCLQMSIAHV